MPCSVQPVVGKDFKGDSKGYGVKTYTTSSVKSAIVFCILDFHEIRDLLYSINMPDVDLHEELLP